MADLDSHKLAIDYLRQIQYQKQKNVSCQTIQDQWQQILVAGGKQNLIGLAKLRHQWHTDLDPFLLITPIPETSHRFMIIRC